VKFLTDSQTKFRVVEMLRGLEWDVATVYQFQLDQVDDDSIIVKEARALNRVLVSFDYMVGTQKASVSRELREGGGRLIRIGGGPDQPAERSVGKLLFHYETWFPWLDENEGKVEIADLKQKCVLIPRDQIRVIVQRVDAPQFDPYLDAKKDRRKKPVKKRRRKSPAKEQGSLVMYGGTKAEGA
jgi:hypothetical protein